MSNKKKIDAEAQQHQDEKARAFFAAMLVEKFYRHKLTVESYDNESLIEVIFHEEDGRERIADFVITVRDAK